MNKTNIIPIERIESRILLIREKKVMIDRDLAELYGVTTKSLNQAVTRNKERFPDDFIFKLNRLEKKEVVTNCDHLADLKFSPSLPNAFTEHGAIMAASVLNSAKAAQVSVFVVRAFVKLRELAGTTKELQHKLTELERKVTGHDDKLKTLVVAIRQLMDPPKLPEKKTKMAF